MRRGDQMLQLRQPVGYILAQCFGLPSTAAIAFPPRQLPLPLPPLISTPPYDGSAVHHPSSARSLKAQRLMRFDRIQRNHTTTRLTPSHQLLRAAETLHQSRFSLSQEARTSEADRSEMSNAFISRPLQEQIRPPKVRKLAPILCTMHPGTMNTHKMLHVYGGSNSTILPLPPLPYISSESEELSASAVKLSQVSFRDGRKCDDRREFHAQQHHCSRIPPPSPPSFLPKRPHCDCVRRGRRHRVGSRTCAGGSGRQCGNMVPHQQESSRGGRED